MPSRGNRTGRIRSDQRPTDNSAPILGQNLSDIGEDYEDALHETVKRGMDTSAARTTGGGSCGLQSFGRRTARNTTKLEFARWLRSI
jgi:hypothetical protein